MSLRLFDEKSPRYNEFLSTEASLKLRQRSVRGGGSVSAANIANHIHMLADKFDGSFVEGLIDTVKTMLDGWLSPDQWAIDLVESMPFYESDFDMFGRKWQPSLAPDGYLRASEMGKVPLTLFAILALGKFIPRISPAIASAGLGAYGTLRDLRNREHLLDELDSIDEDLDALLSAPQDNLYSTIKSVEDTRLTVSDTEDVLSRLALGIVSNNHSQRVELFELLKSRGFV